MAKTKMGPGLAQRLTVEALGVFFLVFFGMGSAIVAPSGLGLLSTAIAHGVILAIAVTLALSISGGHINPAVTFALWITRRIKSLDAALYVVAQVVGGAVATLLLVACLPASAAPYVAAAAPSVNSAITVYQAILVEAVITFALVSAVFGTVVNERSIRIGGFGVGLTLMVAILFAGPLTGAAANPSVALGPEIALLSFNNWYVYWIGPLLGALISALIFEYLILKR